MNITKRRAKNITKSIFYNKNYVSMMIFGATLIMLALLINHFIVTIYDDFDPDDPSHQDETSLETVQIGKGDTLSAILNRQNLPRGEINQLISLANSEKITKYLKVGSEVVFEYIPISENVHVKDNGELEKNDALPEKELYRMRIMLGKHKAIEFIKKESVFSSQFIETKLYKTIAKYEAVVESNIIESLKKAGLSLNTILNLVSTYSSQIDFQRIVRTGDKMVVLAEKFSTGDNALSHHGKILYAEFIGKKGSVKIYNYKPQDQLFAQYFNNEGQSIKTALLEAPLRQYRISSHYGYRNDPVKGNKKMHKGVDYAAPLGSPIYAAADGVVDFMGWKTGYGNFISIKHNNILKTNYAHASKFATNIKRGKKVKQGELIAYVGKTGKATGPHLHHEVLVSDKYVNPLKFKSMPGIKLKGKQLNKFLDYQNDVAKLINKLDGNIELAEGDTGFNIFKPV